MPIHDQAAMTVTAFCNTPSFAHGHVRDLRVRWACEEIGRPYRVELFDAMTGRDEAYLSWQPFGQVPAFEQDGQRIFESGAILLYLGEQDKRLLPQAPDQRWQALSWTFAALNSVEPAVMQLTAYDVFYRNEPWVAAARPTALGLVEQRLTRVAAALGERDWLAGPFTIADILMVTVLRNLDDGGLLDRYPALAAYKSRGEARPAFRQALADQLAGLGVETREGEPA